MTLTNDNSMYGEIKMKLNSANACCRSVHDILYAIVLPNNINIKNYIPIILPDVDCGCQSLSLTLRLWV
jgi:hypothetical protein